MKKIITLLFSSLLYANNISAQTPISYLDINNVKAGLLNHGDMFWNPATFQSNYEFPKGSGKTSMFAAGLWIAGTDSASNTLNISAQTYRTTGEDFWSGPLSFNGTIDSTTSMKWNRFWKVNKTSIDSFLSITTHTIINTPNSILDWPAYGNIYVKDAYGNPLSINADLAPFIDVNSDGIYNPLLGDYPKIKGEQSIWWIYNDQKTHTLTNSLPLNIQIKVMAYACNSFPELQNVTYYNYELNNFSNSTILNTRIGFFNDIDLGYPFDDYIGFDSSRRLAICYNGDNFDEGSNGYGSLLTQTGICITKTPNDIGNYKDPLGSYTTFNVGLGEFGNPTNSLEYYDYMVSKNRVGNPFRKSCNLKDTTQPTVNYIFPDEPNNTLGWSEKNCNNLPGDRRMILTTNDFNFTNNATPLNYEMAIMNTPLGSSNVDFSVLKSMTDFVIAHPNGCTDGSLPVIDILLANDVKIYPNPSTNLLNISWSENKIEEISLLNIIGEKLFSKKNINTKNIIVDINNYQSGIYFLQLNSAKGTVLKKIIKK